MAGLDAPYDFEFTASTTTNVVALPATAEALSFVVPVLAAGTLALQASYDGVTFFGVLDAAYTGTGSFAHVVDVRGFRFVRFSNSAAQTAVVRAVAFAGR